MKPKKNISIFTKIYNKLRPLIIPISLIEKFVPENGMIIDIGCGYGTFASYLAKKSENRNVIGIDISEKRIEQANKLYQDLSNLKFICKDINDADIPKANAITAIDIIHHIPTLELQTKLLESCFSVLQDKGKIIIKDVDKKPLWKYWWNWIHDFIMTKGEPVLYQDQKPIKKLLEGIGFKLEHFEEIRGYPYAHVLYIAKKMQ